MDHISEIVRLIRKKIDGTITDQESLLLEKWAEENSTYQELLDTIAEEAVRKDVDDWLTISEEKDEWDVRLESTVLRKIASDRQADEPNNGSIFRRLLVYAAVLLTVSSFTFIFYRNQVSNREHVEVRDLTPGSSRASLRLSDGGVFELRGDQQGVILGEALTYEDGTFIAKLQDSKSIQATIETPRGGQYQVTLSDGTKVWLNAETTLKYPVHFTGESRVVELIGEAYFDVAHVQDGDERIPFLVKTAGQEVEVLGTQFNVKSYSDDSDVSTTLVEGAVQLRIVGKSILLQPGEQGVSSPEGLFKRKVDVGQYIAWKNNEFLFEETTLRDALKMLSRWYDFDVSLDNKFPVTHLYGSISRSKNLMEVLEIMESSGLKFKIVRANNRNRLIYYMNQPN